MYSRYIQILKKRKEKKRKEKKRKEKEKESKLIETGNKWVGGVERSEDGRMVQTSSYKIKSLWGCKIQHGQYS